jgi:hypothetical protein
MSVLLHSDEDEVMLTKPPIYQVLNLTQGAIVHANEEMPEST